MVSRRSQRVSGLRGSRRGHGSPVMPCATDGPVVRRATVLTRKFTLFPKRRSGRRPTENGLSHRDFLLQTFPGCKFFLRRRATGTAPHRQSVVKPAGAGGIMDGRRQYDPVAGREIPPLLALSSGAQAVLPLRAANLDRAGHLCFRRVMAAVVASPARSAARPEFDVAHAIMGFAGELFDAAEQRRALKVVDCPNSHPTTYYGYWQRECDLWCPGERVPIPRWMFARMNRELERADLIIVQSDFARDSMMQNGIPGEKVFVNPMGVDTSIFKQRVQCRPGRALSVSGRSVCAKVIPICFAPSSRSRRRYPGRSWSAWGITSAISAMSAPVGGHVHASPPAVAAANRRTVSNGDRICVSLPGGRHCPRPDRGPGRGAAGDWAPTRPAPPLWSPTGWRVSCRRDATPPNSRNACSNWRAIQN